MLGVFQGGLYATGYDVGGVFRYEGEQRWSFCGNASASTQLYSFASYRGLLHTGVWPTGSVYRQEDGLPWLDCGRLGEELEVMGMMVYNGKLYAGTLPTGSVYRYDGEGEWVSTGQLDTTPDVKYRRAWTMAVYQGRLFCGTLPSGNVLSLEAGKNVTHDHALPGGWHHLAAVRADGKLRLYVDGALVADVRALQRRRLRPLSRRNRYRSATAKSAPSAAASPTVRLYNRGLSDTASCRDLREDRVCEARVRILCKTTTFQCRSDCTRIPNRDSHSTVVATSAYTWITGCRKVSSKSTE